LRSISACFVVGIVTSTAVLQLDKVFAESGHSVFKLPIGLLSVDNCKYLMDSFEKNNPTVWGNWRMCRAFRTVLSDFGFLSHLAEKLFQAVEKKIQTTGKPLMDVDYEPLYSIFLASLKVDAHILSRYGSTLISAAMLSMSVSRCQFACSAPEDGEKDSRLTVGALEVNINTANFGELKTIPGIGDNLARTTLQKRKEFAFCSWKPSVEDFKKIRAVCEILVEELRAWSSFSIIPSMITRFLAL